LEPAPSSRGATIDGDVNCMTVRARSFDEKRLLEESQRSNRASE
jgi:hypothetical protein